MVVSYLVDASFSSYRDCIKVQTVFQKLLHEIKIFFAPLTTTTLEKKSE
jgi:hypothetical protein